MEWHSSLEGPNGLLYCSFCSDVWEGLGKEAQPRQPFSWVGQNSSRLAQAQSFASTMFAQSCVAERASMTGIHLVCMAWSTVLVPMQAPVCLAALKWRKQSGMLGWPERAKRSRLNLRNVKIFRVYLEHSFIKFPGFRSETHGAMCTLTCISQHCTENPVHPWVAQDKIYIIVSSMLLQ